MKESLLSKVAQQVKTSRSTVSKVLNHSFGVSDELRQKVFEVADNYGLTPKNSEKYDVYVILPETPAYFWGELYDRLSSLFSQTSISVKFNIYSKLGGKAIAERYLNEAEKSGARLIIIAAHNKELEGRLSEISSKIPVISICEEAFSDNVISIGSNQEADGMLLAKHCIEDNPNAERILLIGRAGDRLDGFYKALNNRAYTHYIETPLINFPTLPEMSRILAKTYSDFPFDVIICLSGFTSTVCRAMKKCSIRVPCYGFEFQSIEKRYMLPGGTVIQDIAGIADKAFSIANDYLSSSSLPSQRKIYIPSRYLPF